MKTCITDSEAIADDIYTAITDFEQETFQDIQEGLESLGAAVGLIPSVVGNCKHITSDLQKLISMAEILANPISLVYNVGKNLILNGVEIYGDIDKSVEFYKNGDYFNFGKEIGITLDEIILKSSNINGKTTKNEYDAGAYHFLVGFEEGSGQNLFIDVEMLYNNIDGLGMMTFGPVKGAMDDFSRNSNAKQAIWLTLHEISHSLLEGAQSLVYKGAISKETQDALMIVAKCLNTLTPNEITAEIESIFMKAFRDYNLGDTKSLGQKFGLISVILCRDKNAVNFLAQ